MVWSITHGFGRAAWLSTLKKWTVGTVIASSTYGWTTMRSVFQRKYAGQVHMIPTLDETLGGLWIRPTNHEPKSGALIGVKGIKEPCILHT